MQLYKKTIDFKESITLCVSGDLGFECFSYINSQSCNIVAVFTDKESIHIINLAKHNDIPLFVGNPREGKGKEFLISKIIGILFSINYLYIIDSEMLQLPWIYAVNFHGSILPKYRGRTPHVWAIINGEEEVGITAHIMEDNCDTGDIILQYRLPINRNTDTGATILEKYKETYPLLISEICTQISTNKIVLTPQDHSKATCFGRRTPADGIINWNWFKERIFSWVQAQAHPYPGAFTFYNGEKVTIDRVDFEDFSYSNDTPNGYILKGGKQPLIKVPNGIIKIAKNRSFITFKDNDILQ